MTNDSAPSSTQAPSGYAGAPRARIFEREAPKVADWAGFKKLIRYNNFEVCAACLRA